MIDTKALREKILDLAMRGKLVPQDPNDEPASELLKRIKAEKEELIKQKKIKPDKNESEIFKTEDGSYYEKFADGIVKSVEVPYEIPEGWEWVRIKSIYWNLGQRTPSNDFYYLDTGTIDNNCQKLDKMQISKVSCREAPSRARKIVQKDSVIFSTVRSYLKNIAVIAVDNPEDYIASTAFIVLDTLLHSSFLLFVLTSQFFLKQVSEKSTGSNYPAINDKNFNSLFIPIPPLNEQNRITEQIKFGFESIGKIDKNQSDLQQLSEQLRQKVLDVAMQGKLVAQDPNDEPASVLLEKIRAEKQRLFEEGKLKKKDLIEIEPVLTDDNAYYRNLPESWEVSTLGNIINLISGRDLRINKIIEQPDLEGI
ncbi:restriction endonuclease subunit S, partial [Streptococcus azizii]